MIDRDLILHLTLINDIGPGIIQKITALLRSGVAASDLYSFSACEWMRVFGFSDVTAQKLVDGLQNKKILEYELDLIERNNITWVTTEDLTYPSLLREIYLPPVVLYWQGQAQGTLTKKEASKFLAIVGARKADAYGYRVVNALIPDLVTAQYTIVSGGAHGIDTMAHEATLKHGGKTIAVLGSGLLMPYPHQNKKLFKSIVDQGGLVVSSFPLTMEPLPGNFPARNRIITGLSHGCLVVQAAQKSGALISAHYAMEQGREVFAIPGLFDNELSAGCNALIQSGAKLVMNSSDILHEFGDRIIIGDLRATEHKSMQLDLEFFQGARPEPVEGYLRALEDTLQQVQGERGRTDRYNNYSVQQKNIIAACKRPISFDDVVSATQLTFDVVQSELFNLQLDGVVEQDFTGMWSLAK